MSPDRDLHQQITMLVNEEHELRTGEPSPERRQKLAALERHLDQLWDLLRRRDAAREFGEDPGQVHEQSEAQVENYLQ